MNCETFRDQWHDRADGELAAADAAALDAHAATCDACRRYDAQMRAVLGGLDRLRDRPMAAATRPHRSHRFAPLRVAAAIALFIGGTWLLTGVAMRRSGNRPAVVSIADRPAPDRDASFALTGESADEFIAMAKPSSEPNVRLYWLYRVREPAPSDSFENQSLN